ncbi:hypothetical protein BGZ57DRAFT_960599 [Hyaloscypha finlandica]|nr:hypothetical protein BGZ57DRAFT_960599 [Hyaloscypha finlandica]KAH8747877.1 hypothetical protein F5882DRAFT_446138 [Hyaloscypha sp. PMI_1271]
MWCAIYDWVLLALWVINAEAIYTIQCTDLSSSAKIQSAITEASAMATNALAQLLLPNEAMVAAAFTPLFIASDVPTLQGLYTKVQNIATDPFFVTFFCDENHIQWSDPRNGWMDTAYTYTSKDGKIKHVTQYRIAAGNPGTLPGTKGSYTSLGYQIQMTADVADCSDQAHVYVWPTRINPPTDGSDGYDHRSLSEINSQGIDPNFAALDTIKPLSETIFHELMHVYGGLVNPTSGVKKIVDVINGNRIRGYQSCVSTNVNRLVNGYTPLQAADPPTILAKALYLQPKNKPPMMWDTGVVDPNTGTPVGLPGPGANPKRQIAVIWEG